MTDTPLINQIESICWSLDREYRRGESEDVDERQREAVQSILTAFDTFLGEDEPEYSNLDGDAGYWEKHGRNAFRRDLKAKLKKEGV